MISPTDGDHRPKRTFSRALAAVLALVILTGCGGGAPSSFPSPPQHIRPGGRFGPLRVEGTDLLGMDGTPVRLRGISSHGLAWFPQYINAEVLRQMSEEWGCSVFRVAMYTEEEGGYCLSGRGDREELEQLVDTAVRATRDLGMYVIIDWHILSDGDPRTHQDEAVSFFGRMAERYADMDHVLYEICNEPNGDTTWEDVRQYADAVIPVIREHTGAVVLVGAPGWTHDILQAAEKPLDQYENVMYTYHFYAATHGEYERVRLEEAVAAGLPVFVTEFGICEATGDGNIDVAEADRWMDLMERLGISHVLWSFSNKNESAAFLLEGCEKTSGFAREDLSRTGLWFVSLTDPAG